MVGVILETSPKLEAKGIIFSSETVATCLRTEGKGSCKIHLHLLIDVEMSKTYNPRSRKMIGVAGGNMVPIVELIGVEF